jgi:hypothetical protein
MENRAKPAKPNFFAFSPQKPHFGNRTKTEPRPNGRARCPIAPPLERRPSGPAQPTAKRRKAAEGGGSRFQKAAEGVTRRHKVAQAIDKPLFDVDTPRPAFSRHRPKHKKRE